MYIPMKECLVACGGLPFKGVIHIGAHTGQEARDYLNNGVKRVAWFEANPELIQRLKNDTKNFSFEEQQYFNVCLSDEDNKEIEFNIANNEHSSSILKFGTHAKMYPHVQYTKKLNLKTRRFEEVAKENNFNLKDYDFINIDVQGAELMVLKGFGDLLKPSEGPDLLENNGIKAIYSEINLEHVYEGCCLVEELDSYLGQFGFRRILTRTPPGTWGDCLYFRL